MDEQQDQSLPGCGKSLPIDDPINSPLPGCGGKIDVKPEDLILKVDYSNGADKTWVDSNGNIWAKGDLSGQDVKFKDKNKEHLFGDRDRHLIDTPENRQRILDLVKNHENFLIKDELYGKLWYGKTLPDGTQLWAEVIDNVIRNCGINDTPREVNKDTGLSAPQHPNKR